MRLTAFPFLGALSCASSSVRFALYRSFFFVLRSMAAARAFFAESALVVVEDLIFIVSVLSGQIYTRVAHWFSAVIQRIFQINGAANVWIISISKTSRYKKFMLYETFNKQLLIINNTMLA